MKNNTDIKKIGYFETWNSGAGMIEKSSSRLQSFVVLLFTFIIIIIYVQGDGSFSDWGFLTFILIMLVAAFTPKHLKDIAQNMQKVQNKNKGGI